jgi:hypothetical protein
MVFKLQCHVRLRKKRPHLVAGMDSGLSDYTTQGKNVLYSRMAIAQQVATYSGNQNEPVTISCI